MPEVIQPVYGRGKARIHILFLNIYLFERETVHRERERSKLC